MPSQMWVHIKAKLAKTRAGLREVKHKLSTLEARLAPCKRKVKID